MLFKSKNFIFKCESKRKRLFYIIFGSILTLISIFALAIYLSFIQSSPLISSLAHHYDRVLFYVDTNGRKFVSLTFDDCPNEESTYKILNLLERYNSTATFFVIGSYINQNTEPIIQRILTSGHEIGNHMMFDRPSVELNEQKFNNLLISTQKQLEKFSLLYRDEASQIR